jgi:hypothetical protein
MLTLTIFAALLAGAAFARALSLSSRDDSERFFSRSVDLAIAPASWSRGDPRCASS